MTSIISRLVSSESACSTTVGARPPPLRPRLDVLHIGANRLALLQPCLSRAVLPRSCPAAGRGDVSPTRPASHARGRLQMVTGSMVGSNAACPDVSADGNVSVLCISPQISSFQPAARYQTLAASAGPLPVRVQPGPNPESPEHQGPMMLTCPNISSTLLARSPSVSPPSMPRTQPSHPLHCGITVSGLSPGQEGQRQ